MYISTRGNYPPVFASQAIKLGMVPTGGLFVPESIPQIDPMEIMGFMDAGYLMLAEIIMSTYLDDYTPQEIEDCVQRAYNSGNFYHAGLAPLEKLGEQTYVMELWHGPTAAFKDMALQVMPHLLSYAINKNDSDKEVVILVATSGDTGKAALEGFKNVEGIKIIVFFPHQGVSKVQELQMTTTDGKNTSVVAVKGNFDDCQGAVKAIFGDEEFNAVLQKKGYELSSANSINWGRLLPQIIYYFYAYLRLLEAEEISGGEKINFVVPTGNFGNILAGWYAKAMGLPINRLICASNENKVLTDFFHTGVYDRKRELYLTMSPSMDILVSSNLERFLFEITGHDSEKTAKWLQDLEETGRFVVEEELMDKIREIIYSGYATEDETLDAIKECFAGSGYTLDPHTAVGMRVYEEYLLKTNDECKTVLMATASPFKFNASVLKAIKGEESLEGKDEFVILKELSETIGQPVHPALWDLEKRIVHHKRICEKENIKKEVEEILGQ